MKSLPLHRHPVQALGTSYVNELDSQKALHNLKAWVEHNPKYSGLEIAVDEYSDGTLMDEVTKRSCASHHHIVFHQTPCCVVVHCGVLSQKEVERFGIAS